jgi:hypothetical protein
MLQNKMALFITLNDRYHSTNRFFLDTRKYGRIVGPQAVLVTYCYDAHRGHILTSVNTVYVSR